ncbi:hypothetical protein MLD38_034928 [Melastoma candidum]|uniref:Uncharacterized protein n=1 Tax=Melastoma candidum TaxID=119954 RepID=A0ACB9MBH9_9MYRT|nr:hypothetical protein MLD38_034928 [Melastoma candidum]
MRRFVGAAVADWTWDARRWARQSRGDARKPRRRELESENMVRRLVTVDAGSEDSRRPVEVVAVAEERLYRGRQAWVTPGTAAGKEKGDMSEYRQGRHHPLWPLLLSEALKELDRDDEKLEASAANTGDGLCYRRQGGPILLLIFLTFVRDGWGTMAMKMAARRASPPFEDVGKSQRRRWLPRSSKASSGCLGLQDANWSDGVRRDFVEVMGLSWSGSAASLGRLELRRDMGLELGSGQPPWGVQDEVVGEDRAGDGMDLELSVGEVRRIVLRIRLPCPFVDAGFVAAMEILMETGDRHRERRLKTGDDWSWHCRWIATAKRHQGSEKETVAAMIQELKL